MLHALSSCLTTSLLHRLTYRLGDCQQGSFAESIFYRINTIHFISPCLPFSDFRSPPSAGACRNHPWLPFNRLGGSQSEVSILSLLGAPDPNSIPLTLFSSPGPDSERSLAAYHDHHPWPSHSLSTADNGITSRKDCQQCPFCLDHCDTNPVPLRRRTVFTAHQ